jgi:hypothetical protein
MKLAGCYAVRGRYEKMAFLKRHKHQMYATDRKERAETLSS